MPAAKLKLKMKPWQQYQEDAATFFRSLGLEAEVEAKVNGVRGEHNVDVKVKGNLHGVDFAWIVECKAWRSNIPKEKVMALAAIVEDAGADRGFLLSEVGFQSAAIQQAGKRNITLTSIQDLRQVANESAIDHALAKLAWRADRAKAEIYRRYYQGERHLKDFMPPIHWYYLDYLSTVFDEASRNNYPLLYCFDSSRKLELFANTVDELLAGVALLVNDAGAFLAKYPALSEE
jgi:hypothetical protein